MVQQSFSVDLNKPLAFQVGHLGEAYDEWVHQPIVSKGSPRLFANDFIEFFTKTRWWVVPLFWLPFVWWFVWNPTRKSVARKHTVVGGEVLWTFMEYCLHRFLFHIKTTGYWGNTFHYIFHGCHHKHPMDDRRLVLPPPATAVFVVVFWNLTKLLIPSPHSWSLCGGMLLGYVIYDCTHYYLHHGKPLKPGLSRQLKGECEGEKIRLTAAQRRLGDGRGQRDDGENLIWMAAQLRREAQRLGDKHNILSLLLGSAEKGMRRRDIAARMRKHNEIFCNCAVGCRK